MYLCFSIQSLPPDISQVQTHNSCSCRGVKTSTLRIPLIKYLYPSICSTYLFYSTATRWVGDSSVLDGCYCSGDIMAVVQLQAWCYNSCSCRGVNTSTLRIPLIKYLYLRICHSPTPHARSCSYVSAYMSEFAYCSTRMLCQQNACRTHRGDRNNHRSLMSRLNTFHGTQATNFSTPAPMNELKTFQHLHSGNELFFQHLQQRTSYIYVTSTATENVGQLPSNMLRHVCGVITIWHRTPALILTASTATDNSVQLPSNMIRLVCGVIAIRHHTPALVHTAWHRICTSIVQRNVTLR